MQLGPGPGLDACHRDALLAALGRLDARLPVRVPVLIGEERRDGDDPISTDPGSPDRVVAIGATATAEDVPAAVAAATRGYERWSRVPAAERAKRSDEAAAMLQTMAWPGNIRQLRNVVERVLILGDSAGPIEPAELPGAEPVAETAASTGISAAIAALPLREARELFERDYLLAQINRFGGNISRTASFVGMERSALHRKLKSLGVVSAPRGFGRGFGDFGDQG